jgi:CheY-like chemotaxis protein
LFFKRIKPDPTTTDILTPKMNNLELIMNPYKKQTTMQKVLVVDDHPLFRRLLSITLGKEYEILEAEDGTSALELIRRQRPQIVLLDVMMPGELDGLQVLDVIKADPNIKDTLVAMVTARGQVADGEDARKRGADAYFIKPFSPFQVIEWVRGHSK